VRAFVWLAVALSIDVAALVVSGQPRAQAVWIDTDPAVGEPERDVDDGLALVQAFHSPEIEIRGISVVFGNAPLDRAVPIARTIAERFGPDRLQVFAGAASDNDLGRETEAGRALAAALAREPLSILALGPATNVASLVQARPDLRTRIQRIVAVAGRRPGRRFTTGTANPAGHRDFNFELDPKAFEILLAARVPLVLAPFEISSKVWIRDPDLRQLEQGGSAARWLAAPARDWLGLWRKLFAVDGFNPFDTLAVAYVTHPGMLACERVPASIAVLADDVTEAGVQGTKVREKPYLIVSRDASGLSEVTYCYDVDAAFKSMLLARLARRP
jgi:pyrimidine-specific ribonucleoside hydrolase